MHGKAATLHLEDLWIKGVEIKTSLVDTYSHIATPLKLVASRQLELDGFITTASRWTGSWTPTTFLLERGKPAR